MEKVSNAFWALYDVFLRCLYSLQHSALFKWHQCGADRRTGLVEIDAALVQVVRHCVWRQVLVVDVVGILERGE